MNHSLPVQTQQQLIHEMYLHHHDWLQQWLRHRVSYPFNAADVVQDTFLKLLQTKQQLFAIQEPRAYLVNVAKHLLIDKQRRYSLEKKYLENLKQQYQDIENEVTENQIEEVIQILDFLSIALENTDILSRKAFLMYYFEGYNQSEIAKHIGKSLRTTQTYLADCLQLCFEARKSLLELDNAEFK